MRTNTVAAFAGVAAFVVACGGPHSPSSEPPSSENTSSGSGTTAGGGTRTSASTSTGSNTGSSGGGGSGGTGPGSNTDSGGTGAAGNSGSGSGGGTVGSGTVGSGTVGGGTGGNGGNASPSSGSTGGAGASGEPRVAVLGSSTAAGYLLDDPETSWVNRYTAYLKEHLPNVAVKNYAVGGFTTYHILPTGTDNPSGVPEVDTARNISAALDWQADAILINMPSNDANNDYSIATSMANLHTVVDLATSRGVEVWVSTTQPRRLNSGQVELLVGVKDKTVQDFGDHALDFWAPVANADGTILEQYDAGDGTHLNAEGHQLLFEVVRDSNVLSVMSSL